MARLTWSPPERARQEDPRWQTGLNQPSWARTEDITAVSTGRFTRSEPLGTVSADEITGLREWLREMVAF